MPDRVRSPADVCEVLTEVFRGRGAYASTPGAVETRLRWHRFLGDDREAWRALCIRAQADAEGGSARARARALGWSRGRFERAWRRGAAAVAAGLVRERKRPPGPPDEAGQIAA